MLDALSRPSLARHAAGQHALVQRSPGHVLTNMQIHTLLQSADRISLLHAIRPFVGAPGFVVGSTAPILYLRCSVSSLPEAKKHKEFYCVK